MNGNYSLLDKGLSVLTLWVMCIMHLPCNLSPFQAPTHTASHCFILCFQKPTTQSCLNLSLWFKHWFFLQSGQLLCPLCTWVLLCAIYLLQFRRAGGKDWYGTPWSHAGGHAMNNIYQGTKWATHFPYSSSLWKSSLQPQVRLEGGGPLTTCLPSNLQTTVWLQHGTWQLGAANLAWNSHMSSKQEPLWEWAAWGFHLEKHGHEQCNKWTPGRLVAKTIISWMHKTLHQMSMAISFLPRLHPLRKARCHQPSQFPHNIVACHPLDLPKWARGVPWWWMKMKQVGQNLIMVAWIKLAEVHPPGGGVFPCMHLPTHRHWQPAP